MSNNFLNLENGTLTKNSADAIFNLLTLNNLFVPTNNSGGGGGGGGGVAGGGGGGECGGLYGNSLLNKQQQQQHQQHDQQSAFYRGLQQQQQQQKGSSSGGRAITNTGNLGGNNFGQDIFSQSSLNCGIGGGGKLNNEPNVVDYKNNSNLRGNSDKAMGSQAKPFRNGSDGECYINCLHQILFKIINIFTQAHFPTLESS